MHGDKAGGHTTIRFVTHKSAHTLSQEWDQVAPARDAQMAMSGDFSLSEVLEPWILQRVGAPNAIIDIGCGTGRTTAKLAELAPRVVGIDPSSKSVDIARSRDQRSHYAVMSLEEWAQRRPYQFDLAIANMVLMDVLDLSSFCRALGRVAASGKILVTLTHPAFWPTYWGYSSLPGFDYSRETMVEAPFRTQSYNLGLFSTHIHRPLSQYLTTMMINGISIDRVHELRGPEAVDEFPFPRFLAIEASGANFP